LSGTTEGESVGDSGRPRADRDDSDRDVADRDVTGRDVSDRGVPVVGIEDGAELRESGWAALASVRAARPCPA
jgi:hypothetical protein